MQLRTFLTAIISSACVTGALVSATIVPEVQIPQEIDLAKQSGCGSTGPLGDGHFRWYIITSCQPGATLYVFFPTLPPPKWNNLKFKVLIWISLQSQQMPSNGRKRLRARRHKEDWVLGGRRELFTFSDWVTPYQNTIYSGSR